VQRLAIPAHYNELYNCEWAWVHGPLSLQAEWQGTYIDQLGGDPVFLHGCYAFVSYFLTGEHRSYSRNRGIFDKVQVLAPFLRLERDSVLFRGPGAWELAARFSYLDFDDRNLPLGPDGQLLGDRAFGYTLGLNWYLNDNTRLMFDYNYTILDNPNFGHSVASGYATRFMLFW
jgi:phosphate-selective porin OprO/OprP